MPRRTVDDLPEATNQEKLIKELREKLFIAEQKIRYLHEPMNKYVVTPREQAPNVHKIAVSSDWHIGSLCTNIPAISAFYDYAESLGITDHYVAGDLLEGDKVYRGQQYELADVGLARQVKSLEQLCDSLPESSRTFFITGNHDDSFSKQIGMDVGQYIQDRCRGMIYIGAETGLIEIELPTRPFRIAMLHPDGGTAYALSYKMQRIIEAWEGGSKPHLYVIGHFHKAFFMPRYRNVKGFEAGTFQRQTRFMARRGLAAHVGGWIVEIALGELWNTTRVEFVEFFE